MKSAPKAGWAGKGLEYGFKPSLPDVNADCDGDWA